MRNTEFQAHKFVLELRVGVSSAAQYEELISDVLDKNRENYYDVY